MTEESARFMEGFNAALLLLVVLAIYFWLTHRSVDYGPTRWARYRAWLSAWFRSASQDRLISVLMSNNQEEESDEDDPETLENAPISGVKRNDEIGETGIETPKHLETIDFNETAYMAIAKLIEAKALGGKETETKVIEAAFGVTAGGSKKYQEARDGVNRALVILRTPPERFRALDEQSKPAAITRQPPRKKLALEK